MISNNRQRLSLFLVASLMVFLSTTGVVPAFAETEVRMNLELYNSVYRGRYDNWYYTGTGKADMRIASTGNTNMRAEVSVEFYPVDLSGGSSVAGVPALNLKRLWFKANFPNWRLTAGKTKVAWGNGLVFNSGDVIFGSLSPYLDFTQSTIRDDTAFLTAFNIPTGNFSYIEGVLLPPSLLYDETDGLMVQTIDKTSGGLRFFGRLGGWRLEAGYLYKGDPKVATDLLGHRPYFSFHGHAGVDIYAAASLAAGYDYQISGADQNRDSWDEISKTINFSIGAFHQFQTGYNSTLTLRLETLVMPWQNWGPQPYQDIIDGTAGYYGIMIYPEITWMLRSTWFTTLQSIISPVDSSAQITTTFGWHVFQGFTLLGFVVVNTGDENDIFANDRTGPFWPDYPNDPGNEWADYEFNGVNFTLGARYSF